MNESHTASTGFFHDSLSDFDVICERNKDRVYFYKGLLDVKTQTPLLRQAIILLKHVSFLWFVRTYADKKRIILVREFSNVPMCLVGLGLRKHLHRILLLNHHNLQWALNRKWNRKAMCRLQRLGANFLFFEYVPEEALKRIGMTTKSCFMIRHPVKPLREKKSSPDHDVGFFGVWKGDEVTRQLILQLVSSGEVAKIMIGAPNIEQARKDLACMGEMITFVDTTEADDFNQNMQRCGHLCLPYPRKTYEYRVSGLLSDAIANQVSVLIPDFPMLRAQMNWPSPTGDIMRDNNASGVLVPHPLESVAVEPGSFEDHYVKRSATKLAETLEDILESITK